MKVKCPSCKDIFEADTVQAALISGAISKRQRLVIIECPNCYKDIPIDPNNLLSSESQKDKINFPSEAIKCPNCKDGIVSFIYDGDEKFWGCGECGNVWYSKEGLDKAIK